MNMPLVLLNRRRRGNVFTPSALFALAEPGVWYDPSDLTTLFTDTAGTTPVTTPGQTVALALDKSKGLALGSELVTNGDFSDGATGWTLGAGWSVTGGAAVATAVASGVSISQAIGSMVAGRSYRLTLEISSISGGIRPYAGTGGSFGTTVSTTGTYSWTLLAAGTGGIYIATAGTTTATIDNISVRELPGFHATQATAASRPTYGIVPRTGRRNLLTRTEEFENAAWTKTAASVPATNGTAPDGTATADTLREDGTNNTHVAVQSPSASASTAYTISTYFKREAGTRNAYIQVNNNITGTGGACFAWFDLTGSGAASAVTDLVAGFTSTSAAITSIGSGWYRCVLRLTTVSSTTSLGVNLGVYNAARSYTGDGTSGILIWGAQLETGSTATNYQRVGSAFDVTEAGVPSLSYLSFDGVDDFLVTPTITPGIDKVQVFAGVRKLSDANAGAIIGSSSDINTNGGAFEVSNYNGTGGVLNFYCFRSKGTVDPGVVFASGYVAPITNVLTGLGDISGDRSTLRINGTQAAQSTADQGTGNFLAYPLYIGRRGGTTLGFNGFLFGLIVRFGTNLDAGTITSTETWVNGKTGAYA